MNSLSRFIKLHWPVMLDIYLFAAILTYTGYQTWMTWLAGNLNYVEISFAIQNIVLASIILFRDRHLSIDSNLFHQAVATVAFFSGVAIIGQPPSGGPTTNMISSAVIFTSHLIGIVTLFNLGTSFGILIAARKIKTGGLYRFIRHPMYVTDIMFRIGYIISHFNLYTTTVLCLSSACYIYRALLEEKHLSEQPTYREYMNRVPYRFIPFVY